MGSLCCHHAMTANIASAMLTLGHILLLICFVVNAPLIPWLPIVGLLIIGGWLGVFATYP